MNPIYKLFLYLRATLFWAMFLPSVLVFGVVLLLSIMAPFEWRIRLIKLWIGLNLFWLRLTCGLGYQIEGLENIPSEGFIVMSKHSSTWETIAIQGWFRPLVWVVKQELMRLPFFGWGLKAMDAIGLNRGAGRQAIKQLVEQGRQRMDQGRIIVLFPEGTRVLPGQQKPFKVGGAILANKTGYSILPIAHNAGEFWPRHSYIKWPGTIRVVIGPAIEPGDKKADQIIEEVAGWITQKCDEISDKDQLKRLGIES